MLLTIIFDSRVGFYSTVILALITGGIRGNDYTFMAMNLFAGALSVYTVRDIKNRSQIFSSFLVYTSRVRGCNFCISDWKDLLPPKIC